MKIRVGDLRRIIREEASLEEVDVYEPGKEPVGEPLTITVKASELLTTGRKGFIVPSKFHGKIRLFARKAMLGNGIDLFDVGGEKVLRLRPWQRVTIEA